MCGICAARPTRTASAPRQQAQYNRSVRERPSAVICVFTIALAGCDTIAEKTGLKEKPASKDQVERLEARVAELERKLSAKDDERRENKADLGVCLSFAEDKYWNYVKLNGRRVRGNDGDELWRAPNYVWEHAEQLKRNAIEECRIQYASSK
jgi:hypothetical protein